MDARTQFMNDMIDGLHGKAQTPEPVNEKSEAKDAFVEMATSDLLGKSTSNANPIPEKTSDDLRNAFAQSVFENKSQKVEVSEKVIDEYKKEAEKESQEVLGKLLKSLK